MRFARVAALAVLAAGFVGCASDDSEEAGPSSTEATSTTTGDEVQPVAPPTSRPSATTTTTEPKLPCRGAQTAPAGASVEISAVDFRFESSCIEMSADQGLNVTNNGTVTHNVTLQRVADPSEEYLDADLDPGMNNATEALNNQGPGPGVYRLYCKYHEAQGMEAFLEAT